ncbi:hypothetical protein [Elongatibacter sediminis]|uniref:Uncharacterized protein n=1 Tax=Elongatibacter sediminis TaxID=3119006 RepID=A0AAW9RCK9_9GAMM
MTHNIILILVALATATWLFRPALLHSKTWRATVTPLASIIGSGFLVAGPILAHAAGNFAVLAMLGLCGLGYLFGAAIRHNIAHIENNANWARLPLVRSLELTSDLALTAAYFISVAYYVSLFAAFGLRLGGIVDPLWIRIGATATIALLGLVGMSGGLRALEDLEVFTVGIKLAVIAGLISLLAFVETHSAVTGAYVWPDISGTSNGDSVRILLGLVILVQGYETSRYLGNSYDAGLRIRTMRRAQWISTLIYITFILLLTPYFTGDLPEQGGETAIIDMLRPVGLAVAPAIILAALASQSSAAIADMNGAGGLIYETSGKRVSVNVGNLIVATISIGIIWVANIYEIITYASKAFVVYYGLQAGLAAFSAHRLKQHGRASLFAFCILCAALIIVLAKPPAI